MKELTRGRNIVQETNVMSRQEMTMAEQRAEVRE